MISPPRVAGLPLPHATVSVPVPCMVSGSTMKTPTPKKPSQPPTLARSALTGLLGCGMGIGLVGGMIGYHEGGIVHGSLGFLLGAGIGSLIGLVLSPIAYLLASVQYEAGERVRREAESNKRRMS